MTLVEILRHLPADHFSIGNQQIGVAPSLPRGHLERHMQQLPEVRIEIGMAGQMPDRSRQPRPWPGIHNLRRRKLPRINVDYTGVGAAELIAVGTRVGIDLAGERQAIPLRLRQTDQLLQPRGAGRLEMNASPGALKRPPDDRIEREFVAATMDR